MSIKRPHSKSRTGCKQCKTRRIKCDETPICCLNCAKKNLTCEYQDFRDAFENIRLLTPATFQGGLHPSSPQSTISRGITPGGAGPSRATLSPEPTGSTNAAYPGTYSSWFSINDLGYFQYYILHTYKTLPVDAEPEAQQRWQDEVPRLAIAHPFLMHALLSVGAAHQQALLAPAQRNLASLHAIRTHYSKALTLFLDSPKDVKNGEWADALLCFSILISQITLHLESGRPAAEADATGDLIGLLHVLHGAMGVLTECEGLLRESAIGQSVLGHLWGKPGGSPKDKQRDPSGLTPAFEQLNIVAERYGQQVAASGKQAELGDEMSVLRDAITRLRQFFTLVSTRPSSWVYFLTWPIGLSPDFALLLQRRNPVALCVTAHWCVPLWHAPEKWYAGNWPQRLMADIHRAMAGTEWEDGIAWPVRETVRVGKAQMGV